MSKSQKLTYKISPYKRINNAEEVRVLTVSLCEDTALLVLLKQSHITAEIEGAKGLSRSGRLRCVNSKVRDCP